MAIRDLEYSPTVLAYFDQPHRAGTLKVPKTQMVEGRSGTTREGFVVQFQLQVAGQAITDGRYRVYGCPHGIAAAAWVVDQLIGGATRNVGQIRPQQIAEALDLPVEKMYVALIVEDALKQCAAQVEEE
ncbi:MAG: iron-sulfur cluster assembly scaffold protein [Pseudomonadota bacterium]